jgi:hypothetical protein
MMASLLSINVAELIAFVVVVVVVVVLLLLLCCCEDIYEPFFQVLAQ